VTVAVLSERSRSTFESLSNGTSDKLRVEWFSGTGAGGQHRNKSQNSCRITHLPTGVTETRQSRSREANYRDALKALVDKLERMEYDKVSSVEANEKRAKFGSGMRGDKFITLQFQNDRATNHRNGKTCTTKAFMKGSMHLLW